MGIDMIPLQIGPSSPSCSLNRRKISSISSSVLNLQLSTFPSYSLICGCEPFGVHSDSTMVTEKTRASPPWCIFSSFRMAQGYRNTTSII